jgi:hypothetical protein
MFEPLKVDSRKEPEKYQKIMTLIRQKDSYARYWESDLNRYTVNARSLWGINFGMWPQVVIDELQSKKRNPRTFNLLLDKAETFIGSVMGNGYDIRYSPTSGKMDSLVLKLQDMYYSDKKEMFWEHSEMEALLDSTCGVGFQSMYISSKNHHLGNIAWARRNPRRILMSPSWKTSNVDDLHDWMTWGKFSVEEILDLFPVHSKRLEDLRDKEKTDSINHGVQQGIVGYKDSQEKWSDLHTVYELHWIERKREQWEYDKKNGCMFPDTSFPFHSDEDISEKMKYVQRNGLSQDDISLRVRTKTTKYIRAICPTLDAELMLIDDPDLIQCGNVNLFPIGMKMDGQYQGLVDRMIDLNRSFNEYQTTMDSIHRQGAKQGVILDKALSGSDGELEAQIEARWSEDNPLIWVAEGSTSDLGSSGGMLKLPQSMISADIFKREESLLNLSDRLSKVSAAEDSRSQYAGEPNKMFENKIAVGKIGKWYYSKLYELFQKEKAAAYAVQAKYTYSGEQREFGKKDGKETFQINKKVNNAVTGRMETYDDISLLPKIKVSTTLSKDGIDIRSQLRDDLSSVLQSVSVDPNDRLIKLGALRMIFGTITLPDEDKESFDNTIELMEFQARLQLVAGIKQLMSVLQPQPGDNQGALPGMSKGSESPEIPQQISNKNSTEEQTFKGTPQGQMVSK